MKNSSQRKFDLKGPVTFAFNIITQNFLKTALSQDMKYYTQGHMNLGMVSAIATHAYGINDSSNFKSPIAFDAYDLWLGSDFNTYLDVILDDFFDQIEEDLLSVWSTNRSEQES